jgi:hypothetical protein
MLAVPKPVGGADESDNDEKGIDHPAKGLGCCEDPLKQIGDTIPNCVHNCIDFEAKIIHFSNRRNFLTFGVGKETVLNYNKLIIRLFKESHPVAYIIIPVLIAVFMVLSWQGPEVYVVWNPMPLYNLLLAAVESMPEWLTGFLVTGLLISQVFHLNHIVRKHEVLYKNSFLPMLFFMIFLVIIPQFMIFHPVLFVNSILIFILDKLFRIYKNQSPLPLIFDTGFLIGVASLVYLPAISIFLLFAVSILILKTFSWRDWIIGLFGLVLPFFFTFVYYLWIDGLEEMRAIFFLDDLTRILDPGGIALRGYRITIGVVALVMMLTLNRIRQNFYKNVTRIRNFQQVIFIYLIVALLSLAFTGSVAVYRFAILTIPISIMISYYFLAGKKAWWNEVLFWLMMATVIVNYIGS